jgi:hypothetical protein
VKLFSFFNVYHVYATSCMLDSFCSARGPMDAIPKTANIASVLFNSSVAQLYKWAELRSQLIFLVFCEVL